MTPGVDFEEEGSGLGERRVRISFPGTTDHVREAMRRLWRRDYEPFVAYASQLPETAEFADAIRAIQVGSQRHMSERRLKQSVDMSRKMARNEEAFYSESRGDVAYQFGPEGAPRRRGGRR